MKPLEGRGPAIGTAAEAKNSKRRPKGSRASGFDDVYGRYERDRRTRAEFLSFTSIPRVGHDVTHLDLDLTLACNLRCTYCFKVKDNEHQDAQIALDAVTWLIHSSGRAREISVAMIGGEPMLRFKVMKTLVPFAKRRAAQHGKQIHFSVTTNGTLVDDEVLAFFRRWGIGFHTSIDGHPEVQDRHRSYANGKGSADVLATTLPKILSVRPNTCARSTVMPDTAGEVVESFEYFLGLGYRRMAFVPAAPAEWSLDAIEMLRQQFSAVGDRVIELFESGTFVSVKYIDEYCAAMAKETPAPLAPCGVGRGMMLADINGDLWPCHRWSKQDAKWRLGSLYPGGSMTGGAKAREVFYDIPEQKSDYHECSTCVARPICSGGCPAENLEETGDPWKRHVNACRLEEALVSTAARVQAQLAGAANPVYVRHYLGGESE